MTNEPIPVIFDPILKPKPWGGRKLEELFGKRLPPNVPIGESWEIASLPSNEVAVREGPLQGKRLWELVEDWGSGLLDGAPLADGRFPLLIKFLDARENLSVQVHPKPPEDDPRRWVPGVKHEAWYVVDCEPDAVMYIGLQPGVTPDDVRDAANTPRMAELLRPWKVRPGDVFYLPSGTPHALGAGIVVSEIQTPADVTYRLYDWDRLGLDGRPRELHLGPGLANIRYDVRDEDIRHNPQDVQTSFGPGRRRVTCERFLIDEVRCEPQQIQLSPQDTMRIWIVLAGSGSIRNKAPVCRFRAGDVVLVPARRGELEVELTAATTLLEVTVPSSAG